MVDRKIISSKIAHLKKSLGRLKEKKGVSWDEFVSSLDLRDVVVHNLQTAIQGCIDIASHIISDEEWRIPDTLSGLFDVLLEHKVIDRGMLKTMKAMVGFRNLIVHEYGDIDYQKVYAVLKNHLGDFDRFLKKICAFAKL